jgi:uncharacterized protein (DUF983 family)
MNQSIKFITHEMVLLLLTLESIFKLMVWHHFLLVVAII